jgi:hypothetical protein
LTGKKDEDSNAEDEVLFEKLNLPTRSFRPSSAKASDLLKQKRSAHPKHPPINLKRNQTKNLVDSSVLTRLKPRRITMDKERLYEENMALKLKNNNLLQEILKLRTKVAQVERELAKKEDTTETSQFSKPAHMINNLKSAVKELKCEVSVKDEEIHRLRKNIKSTKLNEIELEVQAYIDECTRLRHHLEEIMRQRNTPPMSQGIDNEKSMQGTFNTSAVKKEIEELSIALNLANQENSKLKAKVKEIEKDKKKNIVKKNEVAFLKGENIKLKSKAEQFSRELAQKEASFKEEMNKIKRNLNEAYAKINNSEGKVKDLICENEEKNRQIKFLQESKMINKKDFSEEKKKDEKIKDPGNEFKSPANENLSKNLKENNVNNKDAPQTQNKSEENLPRKTEIPKLSQQLELLDESSSSEKSSEKFSKSRETPKKMKESSESDHYDENFEDFEEVKIKDLVLPAQPLISDSKAKQETFNDEKSKKSDKNSDDYSDDEDQYFDDNQLKESDLENEEKHSKKPSGFRESVEDAKVDKGEKHEKGEKIEKSDKKEKIEKIDKIEKSDKNDKTKSIETSDKPEKDLKPQTPKEIPKNEHPKNPNKKENIDSPEKPKNPPNPEKSEKTSENPENDIQNPIKKPKKSSKSKKSDKKPTNPPSSLFRHLALRLQINRIPRSKALSVLFKSQSAEKSISSSDLLLVLKSPPLSFTDEESKSLCSSLCESSKTSLKSLEEKLITLTENWEIYSPEEEEQIDETIGETISKNREILLETCSKQDPSSQGTISLQSFKKILSKLKIKLPEKVLKYMQLLFYSHNMILDEVPYLNFIKAYTEQAEDDATDEEKAKVARHYLGIIAQILVQNNRTVFDVFECDEAGLITPDNFFAGLQRMGLEEMDEEHVMVLLEALQFDQAEEVCVHIEELEEILNHYGVEKEEEQGHQKKVSMLDSGNYELSEDSRERTLRKESDKGISDNSPFTKNQGVEEEYDKDFN